jgi:TRAP transporter TAXI family solute receptor
MTKLLLSCAIAVVALPLLAFQAVAQGTTEIDPGAVSEGLKAIFSFGVGNGASAKVTKERLNANTVTLVSGTIGGTYVQFGADLASVLDNGDEMRVLPIVGRGSVQSIADILYLKGVDLGIMRADTLDYLERKGYTGSIKNQFTYITKLYNEEMHVIAPLSIKKMSDLNGKRVAIDLPNGGTFVTAITVFERLGIKPVYVYLEQRVAYEKLRAGELDAVVAVQGSPSRAVAQVKGDNLHFVPIDYSGPLQGDYLPAALKAEDYPALIAPGETVDTVAVPAILAAYNWPANTDRYRKVEHFVGVFFDKFKTLQQPPFHPKWKELVLSAPLKGWTRFKPAQDWLNQHSGPGQSATPSRDKFDRLLATQAPVAARFPEPDETIVSPVIKRQKPSPKPPRPAAARPGPDETSPAPE